jgi:hypothetical protein
MELMTVGGYGGFGAINAASAIQTANNFLTPLPPGVVAAIDASPLTSQQKTTLKKSPVSFFVVMADHAEDKVVEFINRVRSKAHAPSSLRLARRVVSLSPRKGNAAYLAAQFLAVSNRYPMQALQVASEMVRETGADALVVGGAAISAAAQNAAKAAQQAGQTAQQVAQQAANAAQQAARQAGKTADQARKVAEDVFKNVFGFGTLGEPATAATAGVTVGSVLSTAGEIAGAVTAAVALANVLVGPLLDLSAEKNPTPPTAADKAAAEQDAKKSAAMDAVIKKDPALRDAQMRTAAKDKLFGIPRDYLMYGGLGVLGLGGLYLILGRKRK